MKRCLDPNDPDFNPEFYDYQVVEFVEDHIAELADKELCKKLGVTEEELLNDPTILTESVYYEKNTERFENAYRDAHGMERPVDLRHYFDKMNLEEAPF